MKNFVEGIVISMGAIALIAIVAFLSGTILFWIWPIAVEPFSALTWLPQKLTWFQSICITWVFSILIKSSNTNNK
jgi:hypothetical protein